MSKCSDVFYTLDELLMQTNHSLSPLFFVCSSFFLSFFYIYVFHLSFPNFSLSFFLFIYFAYHLLISFSFIIDLFASFLSLAFFIHFYFFFYAALIYHSFSYLSSFIPSFFSIECSLEVYNTLYYNYSVMLCWNN